MPRKSRAWAEGVELGKGEGQGDGVDLGEGGNVWVWRVVGKDAMGLG